MQIKCALNVSLFVALRLESPRALKLWAKSTYGRLLGIPIKTIRLNRLPFEAHKDVLRAIIIEIDEIVGKLNYDNCVFPSF